MTYAIISDIHGNYPALTAVIADAMADIRMLPEGVYLFGHNHLQFYAEIEGRLFVNPGSCSTPLDSTCPKTLIPAAKIR